MCGIVAAVSHRNIVPVLIEGLKRLEYRGYDSCGVAVSHNQSLLRLRSVARVADLEAQVAQSALSAQVGISHTRWATHGAPLTHNAHPIFSRDEIAVVHNGIIENHEALRAELQAQGYEFASQTDTEVIAHLIHSHYAMSQDLLAAVSVARHRLRGAYAIAVFARSAPGEVVGARAGSPLVLGLGDHENFIASDALALAGSTSRIAFLEDGDVLRITTQAVELRNAQDQPAERIAQNITSHSAAIELGPYRHYMQKEIFEQPRALSDTLEGIESIDPIHFGSNAAAVFAQTQRILILACGTSYYAGLTAKYWLEAIARLPCDVEVASEYRYRSSVPQPGTLVIAISQSGETADTLSALRHGASLGLTHSLAICNVATSALTREASLIFLTRAGTEVGVASTKAFTTQLLALYLLTLTLAKSRGYLPPEAEAAQWQSLRHLPAAVNAVLALEPGIIAWADAFAAKPDALFLGRGLHWPIALEGALKLKEISYLHAEAYPAGELKHGPLALVTSDMPVVAVAPNDALLEKLKSNLQEVRARGGQLYVCADADTHITADDGTKVLRLPEHYGALSPILHVVALQLLAYHTACKRGTDVDKPRNLAKSVTVE